MENNEPTLLLRINEPIPLLRIQLQNNLPLFPYNPICTQESQLLYLADATAGNNLLNLSKS